MGYLSKDFLDRILVDCPFSMLKDKRLPQQMNLLHFRKKLPPIFNLKQKFSFLRTLWVDLKIRYAVAGSFLNIFLCKKNFETFESFTAFTIQGGRFAAPIIED